MASNRTTGKVIDLMEVLKESLTPSKSLTGSKPVTQNEGEVFCETENAAIRSTFMTSTDAMRSSETC